MTLSELVNQYRVDADDRVGPAGSYHAETSMIQDWLDEAEEEACIRKRLLRETSNGAICTINVTTTAGSVYPLHSAVAWITRADFTPTGDTDPINLQLCDTVYLDRVRPNWRTTTENPNFLIVDDTSVQLGCIPEADGTLTLEVYRVPLDKMEDRASESPEIGRIHHRPLVHWALHRNYSRPDSEVYDPSRGDKELAAFTAYFGQRPDADMRRDQEVSRPQGNVAHF